MVVSTFPSLRVLSRVQVRGKGGTCRLLHVGV